MKKQQILTLLLLVAGALTSSAVAQVATEYPTNVSVTLQSVPEGAQVYMNGKMICASTPATVSIPAKAVFFKGKKKDAQKNMARSVDASTIRLVFKKDGYFTEEEVLQPEFSYQRGKLNIEQTRWPGSVIHEFRRNPNSAYAKDPTIPEGEARKRVSRDNAGQTALERTIIRWYFDSDPKGARVFWRVISSAPAEVKNTNELWLGATPFEETRSFNIEGLTYENARDVQIEIKVRRKGYVEQSKRFNVRQAIDQQEISSFFELVSEEE